MTWYQYNQHKGGVPCSAAMLNFTGCGKPWLPVLFMLPHFQDRAC